MKLDLDNWEPAIIIKQKKQTDICSVREHREHTNYKPLPRTEHSSLSLDRLSTRRTEAEKAAVSPEALQATIEESVGLRLPLTNK